MKKTLAGVALVLVCGVHALAADFGEIPRTRLTLRVVDDEFKPVEEASVIMDCYDRPVEVRGSTDTNGQFGLVDHIRGVLSAHVTKPGYYLTSGELWDGPSSTERAPPTNQYTVVLKRILNPVPMVVRDIAAIMPSLGKPCAFDFLAGDWVAPHGTGVVADCTMVGWKDVKGSRNWDWKCQLLFRDNSGVAHHRAPGRSSLTIRSDHVPPQEAPAEGYDRSLALEESFHTGVSRYESAGPNDHWIFRVRPVTNLEGRVVSAHVGWIEGAIRLEGRTSETLWLGFRYHLNPDPHSRSLEPKGR